MDQQCLYQYMEKVTIQRKEYVNDISIGNIKKQVSLLASLSKDNNTQLQISSSSYFNKNISSTNPHLSMSTNIKNQPFRKKGLLVKFQNSQNILQDTIARQRQNDTSAATFNGNFKQKLTRKEIHLQKTRLTNQQNSLSNNNNYNNNFKNIFNNFRLNNIKTHLYNKLRKNSIYRVPVIYQPFQLNGNQQDQWKGLEIQKTVLNLALFYNITYIFLACFISTLLIAFQNILQNQQFLSLLQIFCLVTLVVDITMGFIRVKEVGSRKLTKIRQICIHYLKSTFFIDFLCCIAMLACLISNDRYIDYLLCIYFLKIPDCIHNLQKIQTKVLQSFYWQQYWGLMKILLTNFFYAHCIATILVMMSWLDSDESWMHVKNIEKAPWYEQYSWAYYWGTTIMLTVGFGDISAANYKQAICLVLIETISCMALAYNINCIGNLISNLKSNQLQKEKRLKTLKKLCDKNEVNSDLNFRLVNHIKQSYNIQKKFNFQQQYQLIQKLPINLKQDFYRTTNYKFLANLILIKNFTNRTVLSLAQKIEMKISHPDEIVMQASNNNRLVILKQGQIGLVPDYNYQKYHKIIIDKFVVHQGQKSVLISLDFLNLPIVRNYHMKSMVYSQIYEMEIQNFLAIIKSKDVDFQYFFSMRDKQKEDLDSFQIISCKNCKNKHTKFRCPKLHYMPISQQIIFKYLHQIKVGKNQRLDFKRVKDNRKILQQYKSMLESVKKSKNSLQGDVQYLCVTEADSLVSRINARTRNLSILEMKNFATQAETKRNSRKISQNSLKTKSIFKAAELMQKEMRGIFRENQDFWSIESDQGKDYKYYFTKHNPKQLQNIKFKKLNISLIKSKSKTHISTKKMLSTLNRKNS